MYKIEVLIKKILKFILKFLGVSQISKVYGVSKSDVSKLFKDLDKNNINYVVLRWYEDLPFVKEGEDIDILVADEDFGKLKNFLKRGRVLDKNFIKIDLFPETSQKRFMAYYPPHLAKKLLHNKVMHKSNAYIPSPKDYFLSLTYHVLFHKGFDSGIESKYAKQEIVSPEHDYKSYLINLMNNLNIKIKSITLESLEQVLEDENWLPPLDIYFRRSIKNSWVQSRALEKINPEWRSQQGLVVFIIRDRGYYENLVNKLKDLVIHYNAKILSENTLSKKQSEFFSERSRGGDWGRGPSIVSGGLPKFVLVCKLNNNSIDSATLETIPKGVVEYEWVKETKIAIRDFHLKNISRNERCNVIHSSDNGIEAAHYLSLLNETINKNEE